MIQQLIRRLLGRRGKPWVHHDGSIAIIDSPCDEALPPSNNDGARVSIAFDLKGDQTRDDALKAIGNFCKVESLKEPNPGALRIVGRTMLDGQSLALNVVMATGAFALVERLD